MAQTFSVTSGLMKVRVPPSERSSCVVLELPVGVLGASLMAQLVKNLPAVWETRVRSLGWEDSPEKEMVIHSNILAWEIS